MVGAVCRAVSVPITVKVRIGFKEGEPTAVPFALAAAEAGVSLITVHGRYAQQGFKGQSDHSVTARVRQALPSHVKVIANGDIVDLASARQVIEQTRCDGLMLGRAALQRPWLFAELAAGLCGKEVVPVLTDPLRVARRHVELSRQLVKKPEKVLVRELRGQLLPYRLGGDGLGERSENEERLRQALFQATSFADLENVFELAESLIEPP